MKLGLKTTGSVPKVKIKTTDGVAKAVACACCDPCASEHPEYLLVHGTCPVRRVLYNGQCQWIQSICGTYGPPEYYPIVTDVVAGYCPLDDALDSNLQIYYQVYTDAFNEQIGFWTLAWGLSWVVQFTNNPCASPPPPPSNQFGGPYLGIKFGPFSDGPTGTYWHDYYGSAWPIEVTAL